MNHDPRTEHGEQWIRDIPGITDWVRANADNPERSGYYVRVRWLATVPESEAFDEVELFGNKNTVCSLG